MGRIGFSDLLLATNYALRRSLSTSKVDQMHVAVLGNVKLTSVSVPVRHDEASEVDSDNNILVGLLRHSAVVRPITPFLHITAAAGSAAHTTSFYYYR